MKDKQNHLDAKMSEAKSCGFFEKWKIDVVRDKHFFASHLKTKVNAKQKCQKCNLVSFDKWSTIVIFKTHSHTRIADMFHSKKIRNG